MRMAWVSSVVTVVVLAAAVWLVVQMLGLSVPGVSGLTQGGSGSSSQAEGPGPAGTDTRDWDGIDACDDLPAQLGPVTEDVEAGGPFEHPGKDGSTFGNREGYLPQERSGYYREYTVRTPGVDHRGARRVVTGGDELDPEVWYYTDDHYESFCEFAPAG